ncbi:MAG: hypothetical protein O3B01_08540 [Planctomycetota bacterium]|nr:hypothetical protein [Planctomycetota bacterium]MDA1138616.1 hypothetical protein [Planctomycetota bacterium]
MALDTGQREQDRMWLKRMSSQKADIIKLIICVGGAIFLLSYLLNTLGKRPELKDEKVHVAPMVIKKDSLPFERRGEEEVIEAQGGFPYGEEVLEKINHKNRYLEPEAYYYLANEVMKRPQEQLRDEANREVTWSDVFVDPQKYQGTTLAITGSLARIREAPLQANPCGLKSVYQGQLIDKDWRFWTFILIERPDKSFQDGDLVRVYGKFFKIWEYETNLPNTSKLNAVIVGKRFVHVELNKDPIAGWYIVGLAAATVLVLTVAQIISKKSDRHVDTIRKAKAQKKRPGGINDMARALSAKAANEQEAALIANREALRKKYMPEPELTDRDKMGEDDETHREETGSLNEEDDSKSGLEEEEVEAEKDEELNSQLEDEDQAGDDDEDDDGNAAKNEG